MVLVQGNEKARVIYMREDYALTPLIYPIEEYASDVITKKKNNKRDKSWFFVHQLLKTCYNVPGIPDGAKALLISPRDVVIDPLGQLDDSWSKEKIRYKATETAREQQHKADANKGSQATNITMMLLSSAVVILVLTGALIALMQYYRG